MLFRKKPNTSLSIDIHSHLIPGVDDGVKTTEDAIEAIEGLRQLGINGCVTTPHFYHEVYPNEEKHILSKASELREALINRRIDFRIEVAGEYFIDEFLLRKIQSNTSLNHFGEDYLLVETSFMDKPPIFEEIIFELRTSGYRPVLAHPERYQYIFENPGLAREWFEQGMLFQVTTGSLAGIYGKGPQKLAQKLVDEGLIHFLGSDLHGKRHLPGLKAGMSTRYYKKALKLPLLNDTAM